MAEVNAFTIPSVIALAAVIIAFCGFIISRTDRFNDRHDKARAELKEEFKAFEREMRPRMHIFGNEIQRLIGDSEKIDAVVERIDRELNRINDKMDEQPEKIIDMWRAARAEMK